MGVKNMDFKGLWQVIKRKAIRLFKKARKTIKKYIRKLIKHTKAGDYSILIYTIFALIALILIIVMFANIFSLGGKKKSSLDIPTTEEATPMDATEDPEIVAQRAMEQEAIDIYNRNRDFIFLVDEAHPLAADYTFEHHTLNCGLDIDKRIFNDFSEMLNACNMAGYEYNIINAYIDEATQTELYNSEVQSYIDSGLLEEEAQAQVGKSVEKPGCSEHETGLAIDITDVSVLGEADYKSTRETDQWFMNNCHKYGFINRFPANKVSITGVSDEQWQFRYVGKEAATFMHDNNLSLEEFMQLVQ
ncbi:MAG: D-alanyl-D-alanine carboxypeptidase family protein [Lachnospiraceae bacterium]|nr:D-alanyl-D-alanine carboxypeptidase family protein [Lachnospiraceae bacterium]